MHAEYKHILWFRLTETKFVYLPLTRNIHIASVWLLWPVFRLLFNLNSSRKQTGEFCILGIKDRIAYAHWLLQLSNENYQQKNVPKSYIKQATLSYDFPIERNRSKFWNKAKRTYFFVSLISYLMCLYLRIIFHVKCI